MKRTDGRGKRGSSPVKNGSNGNRRVFLLIERETGYRQEVLHGIFKYAQQAGNWVCQGADLDTESVEAIFRMRPRPAGIIAGLWDYTLAMKLQKLRGVPMIDVFDWHDLPRAYRVGLDNYAIGMTAANYFLSHRFRDAGFLGHPDLHFSVQRLQGFEYGMGQQQVTVNVAPRGCCDSGVWMRGEDAGRHRLANWVRSLPKPIAVFCAGDGWAMELVNTCRALNVKVPDEVAVLGVDNDELLCVLSQPAISSINTAAERIGYQAAAMLDRLLDGREAVPKLQLVAPGEVVERQSTDVLRVDDNDIAMALRFVRENSHRPIQTEDVVNHVVLPRRTLQRRFSQLVGHSVSEEVRRCRLDRAKRLLSETDLSIPQIAHRCGFASRERLWAVFRDFAGMSPADYRRKFSSEGF